MEEKKPSWKEERRRKSSWATGFRLAETIKNN
jgi:hypothetical protein